MPVATVCNTKDCVRVYILSGGQVSNSPQYMLVSLLNISSGLVKTAAAALVAGALFRRARYYLRHCRSR